MLAKWFKNHNSWIKKSQHIMVSKLKVISLNVCKRNMDCNLFRIVLRVQFYSRKSFSSPFIIQTFEFKLLWPLREFISSQFELWAQLDTRQMLLPNWVFQVIKVPYCYCHFFPQGTVYRMAKNLSKKSSKSCSNSLISTISQERGHLGWYKSIFKSISCLVNFKEISIFL